MARRGRLRSLFCVLALFGAAHACSDPKSGGDSESHFLDDCVATCASGLECLCGVCTKPCTETTECSSFGVRAECATTLEPACASKGNTCDVACLTDDRCAALGQGFACVGGRCRSGASRTDAGGGAGGAGGSGGSGGSEAGGQTSCQHETAPPPPDAASVVTPGGSVEIVAVVKDVDLGDAMPDPISPPTHYLELGFDDDLICTSGTGAALRRNQECVIPDYGFGIPDGPGGIDNAFGKFVQTTRNAIANFSSEIYSTQLATGVTNPIIHVRDYNGEANDDLVRLELLTSAPFDYGTSKGTVPKWDGTDAWPIASDSVVNGNPNAPKFASTTAYVTNGKVVAQLPQMSLRLLLGLTAIISVDLDLPLLGVTLVCDVTQTATGTWGWTLRNCTLGGRLRANDLVHQLSHFPDPANNQPLCTTSNLYSVFRDNVCGLIDVSDNGLVAAADLCSALSVGMTLNAEPALLGNVFQVDPATEPCAAGTEPSADDCGATGAGGQGGSTGSGGAGGNASTGSGGATDSGAGGTTGSDAGP